MRARNRSARQVGVPGASWFQHGCGDGAAHTSHRMRAEDRSCAASSRTSHNGTPCFSEVSVNRREAVKSSALGLPTTSPTTAATSRQRKPSSSANSASSLLSQMTWIRRWRRLAGNPAR